MPTEYNPAADDAAIASPAPAGTSTATASELGDGGMKALSAEREQRKALEKQTKQLEAMLAESKKALEQSNLTLKEQYDLQLQQNQEAIIAEAQKVIAERDHRLQELQEARQISEQRAELLEQQRAIAAIQQGFAQTFKDVLVNPRKVQAYMAEIADDLVVDANGQPALIARRDESGRPVELAPVSAAIDYFKQIYPEDFKAPAEQKTGGGYRNLANATGELPSRSQSQPLKLTVQDIQSNPKLYLENRDRIAAGDFETK